MIKKTAKFAFCITMLTVLVAACSVRQPVERQVFDYLGQEAPGTEPTLFGEGIVSVKGRFDMGFAMSPDGNTMAFGVAHESDTNQTNIYFLQRQTNGWSSPSTQLLPNNHNVFFPMFGPEGNRFYYARAVPNADTDLWKANQVNGKITDAAPLGQPINSAFREAGHGFSNDGLFLFTSNRDQAQACCGDVYQATDQGFEKVEALSSESDEESLFLSPDGDYVIIQAWKPEYNRKHDLYISYRTINGAWTSPSRLDKSINSAEIEQRPFVSPDQKHLFFSRMRIEQKGEETLFDSDIYWVSTEKVFAPYIYNPVTTFEIKDNMGFKIQIPPGLFSHITEGHLRPEISMADGSPLPEGFQFDGKNDVLQGKITGKSMAIRLTATDMDGQSISLNAEIVVRD